MELGTASVKLSVQSSTAAAMSFGTQQGFLKLEMMRFVLGSFTRVRDTKDIERHRPDNNSKVRDQFESPTSTSWRRYFLSPPPLRGSCPEVSS